MQIVETKKVICKYPLLQSVLDENAIFGWVIKNKILLNRFGNPVPLGETIDEDDLKEKCSYELSFTRIVESTKSTQLDSLQTSYSALQSKPTKFSSKRVSGLVWLSILFTALLIGVFSIDNMILLIPLVLTFGGLLATILVGAKRCAQATTYNEQCELKKRRIEQESKKILES